MKKLLVIISLLASVFCEAQWQPDVRLTNNSAGSFTNLNNIGANGDFVHIVWEDNRDGDSEIYYKRSTDGGANWGSDIRLTYSVYSESPSISVSGEIIHVTWLDLRDVNPEIYYKRSTNGGTNWSSDIRLTNNPFNSLYPSISVSGQVVFVAWVDGRDGNDEIYYKRSTNDGINWSSDTRLTINDSLSSQPYVSVSDQAVHIVWYDKRDGNNEVYYKHSSDGGITWLADTRLTNDPSNSWFPAVSASGQIVFVFWEEYRDGNPEVYYRRSTNEGLNWETETRLTNNPFESALPDISVFGHNVHVVWFDNRDGNFEIYYKYSENEGVSWGEDTRLTNSPGESYLASLCVSSQAVHVVWEDNHDGNFEIYYKHNPTGNILSITNLNPDIPAKYKLEQNYPNPFNPETNIKFNITKSGMVKLKIFDILGKELATLVNDELQAGQYKVDFNGASFPSGVYFYSLETETFSDMKKMLLVK